MEQVRDFFLLAETDKTVVWKLVSATTNSPLDVTGMMDANEEEVTADELAAHAMASTSEMSTGFARLVEGRVIEEWREGTKADVLKRILKRNLNGVGLTEVYVNDAPTPDVVTPTVAATALDLLGAEPAVDRARAEVGSIDGDYMYLGFRSAKPAIRIRERKTGAAIWCLVSEKDFERIDSKVRASDVWRHRRVRARGKIFYDSAGDIVRVQTTEIELLPAQDVALDDVRDATFTGGLSVSEYLELFREGNLERN